jgi:two-component system, NarL family, response regulator NreC
MRVLIGVNHALMRYGLIQLIKDVHEVEYIVTAESKEEVLKALRKYPFDYLFIHEAIPGALNFSSIVQEGEPELHIVFIAESTVNEMKQRVSVVQESMDIDSWMRALTRIMKGERIRRSAVQEELEMAGGLSSRETEVFQLKLEGYSVRDSARFLGIKSKTVENHRRNISKKLHLKSNKDWIKKGRELGYL